MIAKTFTPFLGVQPFGIMGFPGNDGAGMGRGLLVWSSGMRVNVQRRPGAGRRRESGSEGTRSGGDARSGAGR
jgi:hypothetical protein